jgi:HlyD family secretion protein
MKRRISLPLIFAGSLLMVVLVTLVGLHLWRPRPQIWQGEVETTEIRISGKLAGRVDTLYVREGQQVRKGDTLVRLHCPEARAKYRQADAMEQAAQSQRQKVDAGTRRPVLRAAEEYWRKTQSDLHLARLTLQRVRALHRDSVVTLQRLDEVQATYQAAVAAEEMAHQQYLLAREGAQPEDKSAAASMQQAAEAAASEVEALLQDAVLTAPDDGQIAVIYPRQGELVGASMPVMTLLVTAHTHVVLNVREDYLSQFPLGGTFEGTVPALADAAFRFRIYYLSPLGSYATWRSIRLSGGYDMKTFEVRARVEEELPGEAPSSPRDLRPGMSVLIPREP